jgi:hypothetical protein
MEEFRGFKGAATFYPIERLDCRYDLGSPSRSIKQYELASFPNDVSWCSLCFLSSFIGGTRLEYNVGGLPGVQATVFEVLLPPM